MQSPPAGQVAEVSEPASQPAELTIIIITSNNGTLQANGGYSGRGNCHLGIAQPVARRHRHRSLVRQQQRRRRRRQRQRRNQLSSPLKIAARCFPFCLCASPAARRPLLLLLLLTNSSSRRRALKEPKSPWNPNRTELFIFISLSNIIIIYLFIESSLYLYRPPIAAIPRRAAYDSQPVIRE